MLAPTNVECDFGGVEIEKVMYRLRDDFGDITGGREEFVPPRS
jgi:hypothetical protein